MRKGVVVCPSVDAFLTLRCALSVLWFVSFILRLPVASAARHVAGSSCRVIDDYANVPCVSVCVSLSLFLSLPIRAVV